MKYIKALFAYVLLVATLYTLTHYEQIKFRYVVNPVVLFYYGSTGSEVIEIQRRLKQWGYYD